MAWAQEHFGEDPTVRIMYRQQWTPELGEDISRCESVIFIDASTEAAPGAVQLHRVVPSANTATPATHHLNASQLLALCNEIYESTPRNALLLTIGIQSTKFGETFSPPVHDALQEACNLLEKLVSDPDVAALPTAPPH